MKTIYRNFKHLIKEYTNKEIKRDHFIMMWQLEQARQAMHRISDNSKYIQRGLK